MHDKPEPAGATPVPGRDRGLLDDDMVERFADLLAEHCGLRVEERERRKLASAIAARAEVVGSPDVAAYFGRLTSPAVDRAELDRLSVRLTVGETSFFRSPPHFEALRQQALPALFGNREDAKIRVLCAGCSTGEEAWSLAITLRDALGRQAQIEVQAVDLDADAIEQAKRAVYGARSMRRVPDWLRDQYFEEAGDDWRVAEPIRKLVKFERGNLKDCPPDGGEPFDVVFCRNTLIYFERREIVLALRRFARLLKPGGYLFLGQTEAIFGQLDDYEVVPDAGGFLFRRRPGGRADRPRTPLPPTDPRPTPPIADPRPTPAIAQPRPTPLPKEPTPPPATTSPSPSTALPVSDPRPTPPPAVVPSVRQLAAMVAEPRRPSTVPPTAPPRTDADQLARAVDLVRRDDYDGALALFEKLAASPLAQLGIAFVLASRDRDDEAKTACARALAIDPFLPEGYFLTGILAQKGGDAAEAERQYMRTVLLDRDFALAWFYLGNLYLREGNMRAARREFQRALKVAEQPRSARGPLRRLFPDEVVQEFCRRHVEAKK